MIKIDDSLISEVIAKAKSSPRLRMNYNLHPRLDDPVQRLLNALEPWSYIRPHKHPAKEELFLLLKGKVLAVTFNDNGSVRDHAILSTSDGIVGIEFEEDSIHMVASLEPDSVVFEVKEGPYIPHSNDSSAPWAPAEGSPEARIFLENLFAELKISMK